jgi:hypothetical protein
MYRWTAGVEHVEAAEGALQAVVAAGRRRPHREGASPTELVLDSRSTRTSQTSPTVRPPRSRALPGGVEVAGAEHGDRGVSQRAALRFGDHAARQRTAG